MNNKFDELTKGIAQSVTRRGALKKFGVGLAGMALACFGLASKAEAARRGKYGAPCAANADCFNGYCRPDGFCGCISRKECREGGSRIPYCEGGYCIYPL